MLTKAMLALAATSAAAVDYGGRIFTVGIFNSLKPYGYIDPEDGLWKGAGLDMVREACDAAGAQCSVIHLTPDQCWESGDGRDMLGPALLGGLVDACAIFTETSSRKWSADFTESLMTHSTINIWHLENSGVTLPITTAQNLRVGFQDGAYYNEAYLRAGHNNAVVDGAVFTPMIYSSILLCFDAIVADEVDICISHPTSNTGTHPTVVMYPGVDLSSAGEGYGAGIMLRKDNRAAMDMFNTGIRRIKSSGRYQKICTEHWPVGEPGSRCLQGASGV